MRRVQATASCQHYRNIFKFEGLHLSDHKEYADVLLPITFYIIFGPNECYMHLNFFSSTEYYSITFQDQKSVLFLKDIHLFIPKYSQPYPR